jgi:hypothetical protein
MTAPTFSESDVETAALEWLRATGWQIAHGPDIAPGMLAAERADYGEPFEAKMQRLMAQLRQQKVETAKLDAAIEANLRELGFSTSR